MCGLAGIIIKKNKNQNQSCFCYSILKREIEIMNNLIAHRGPDDNGYYIGENFAFGHRRLAILDLSDAGHQPMEYKGKNGEYVITYNGEIYNYIELKEELLKDGYVFKSDTDTEVILASYDKWGVECLNKFNGMWSFAIYNKEDKKFFISRDRFGIKPLYYYQDDETFIFASEIKAILAHSKVKTESNVAFIKDYIKYGPKEYIKETAFTNIYRFNFASFFEGTKEDIFNNFKETKFWQLKVNLSDERFDGKKAKEYAKKYYELLKDAVRIRLRSDVKVGSALSGGLDSSSIVYLINEILKEQGKEELQETFSSVYRTKGTEYCDESFFINTLAKKLNVKSNQIEPREKDVPRELKKVIYYCDNMPEGTCMSGWHTFKKAQECGVKVTLDGQGADEQLGGYLLYLSVYFSRLSLKELIKEIKAFKTVPGSKKYIVIGIMLNILIKIFGENNTKKLIKHVSKILNRNSENFLEFNFNKKLANDTISNLITLIHYSDRVSMAHSVESRMPFMDYRLVEFLASIPYKYKIHNGWTKYLARLAFDKKLPDEIVWRKDKMGWPIPHDHWFRGNLKNWLISIVKSNSFIKEVFPEFNIEKEFEKKTIEKILRYLNIAIWYEIFFEKLKKEK